MEPIITINEYPIGWEWLDRVPLEDFTWLIEIFATMTDNTDTYDFATFDKEATNGEPPYLRYPPQEINKNHLHSEFIYLKVILSLITILILIHNENTYQSHLTNKIRYIISQILILIIYTTLMILIQRYL